MMLEVTALAETLDVECDFCVHPATWLMMLDRRGMVRTCMRHIARSVTDLAKEEASREGTQPEQDA